MSNPQDTYFIPEPSKWPVLFSFALFLAFCGAAVMFNQHLATGSMPGFGSHLLLLGFVAVFCMFFVWFRDVINESLSGVYNKQVDISFRWGMSWFIFSEVMFFAAFFGALFYARVYSVPWLGGEGSGAATNEFLWPSFENVWPLLTTPDMTVDGLSSRFTEIKDVIPAFDIPAINTAILLTSGATVTFAHWALKKNQRGGLCWWLFATVLLGFIFVVLQAGEYIHAYQDLGLTLNSGIYGSTFFLLTGFHGFHVTMGAIMLAVILLRAVSGHFTSENHFAFEAVAWYWHFVDVVWLGLFIFVYWL